MTRGQPPVPPATAPLVRRSAEHGITTLTLDSPHNRNALSARLVGELSAALAEAADDAATRAVLLTHTGGTFCAGADLTEITGAREDGERDLSDDGGAPNERDGSGGRGGSNERDGSGDRGGLNERDGSDDRDGLNERDGSDDRGGLNERDGSDDRDGSGDRHGTSAPRALAALLRTVVELPKPVVARITGHVRAGGLGLVGACDIAVAGPEASFAFTEARLGLAPAVISLPLLPRMDPRAAARHYLTGERFDAAEAARTGLVTAAADDVDAALVPILAGLRKASPQGLAESKRLLTAETLRAFDRDTRAAAEQSARLFASSEAREGMTAFLERRDPSWAR
ncbi:enoyl-CoA hydratase family protein [Streptomyces sp. Ru87]|uniref:enoyl-CoA hydratase family protein n=1 Tax=Streptomyces sp. Ru87 TaxID=2044307 RepID=UPI000BF4748E|nr:enoyl-CoA hydratase family protein [Streptomyces sp. Ru87]PGH48974.1 enoyl-CoA hydratase [Streptomyces sp. Ru87]